MIRSVIFYTCFICSISLSAQKKAICDEVAAMPETLTFSFFVIREPDINQVGQPSTLSYKLEVRADSILGEELLNIYQSTIGAKRSGFLVFEMEPIRNYPSFIYALNEDPEREFFAVLKLIDSSGQYKTIGSQPLQSVPYANVANAMGGIGPRGDSSTQGPIGEQGPAGFPGESEPGPLGPAGPAGHSGYFDLKKTS